MNRLPNFDGPQIQSSCAGLSPYGPKVKFNVLAWDPLCAMFLCAPERESDLFLLS